jgi:acetyl esterase/lipase
MQHGGGRPADNAVGKQKCCGGAKRGLGGSPRQAARCPAMPLTSPSPADLGITPADLAEAEAFNRRLARAPRFRIRNRWDPVVLNSLLRLSRVGADRRVRKAGVNLRTQWAGTGPSRTRLRVLRGSEPPRGVVLDIHGGGWAIGNAAMDDRFNLALVRDCGVTVVSVDYRLAGRAPIQSLMDECAAAAAWVLDEAEFAGLPIVIAGESAGAHLAAATLLRLKPRLARFAGALLFYGVYDLAGSPSVRAAGPDTLLLDGPGMLPAMRRLTPGMDDSERRRSPMSPLFGNLAGLPPALMVVGALDPLIDDTLGLAERWAEAGSVELHRVPASPHGFIHFRTALAEKMLARSRLWVSDRIAA